MNVFDLDRALVRDYEHFARSFTQIRVPDIRSQVETIYECAADRGSSRRSMTPTTLRLSCIADDAQGEQIEVLWDAEIGARIIQDDTWSQIGRGAPDSPEVLAAYLRAIRWRTATAADRDLLQAPFRAGIRLDAYQLLPLRKALRLPRVNLLIADDVGLGKTVEAGLVIRARTASGRMARFARPSDNPLIY
jgi:hypothetical protein